MENIFALPNGLFLVLLARQTFCWVPYSGQLVSKSCLLSWLLLLDLIIHFLTLQFSLIELPMFYFTLTSSALLVWDYLLRFVYDYAFLDSFPVFLCFLHYEHCFCQLCLLYTRLLSDALQDSVNLKWHAITVHFKPK